MSQKPLRKPLNYATLWSNIEREATGKLIRYMSRRDFMKYMLVGGAALALLPRLRADAQAARAYAPARQAAAPSFTDTLPNGIASGDTTQTSTVLWTRSTVTGDVTFEISTDETFASAETRTASVEEALKPVKVTVDNLTPDTRYFYRVSNGTDTLTGQFRTAAPVDVRRGLRFGVSGDWRGELRPYIALANVVERDLEFFVEHGDTIYSDIPSRDFEGEQAITVEEFRIKHNEVYSAFEGANFWADVRARLSVLATIDDHEVTNDFAGGAPISTDARFVGDADALINTSDLYRNGMQVFQEYNPLNDLFYENTGDPRMDGRPKLYRSMTYGSDAAVIVLDARSFRDQAVAEIEVADVFNVQARTEYLTAMFEEGRTLLGRTQVEDLKRDLLAAQEAGITWKFVMIPEPIQLTGWFGGSDRWEGYAPERTEVLQFIETNNILNVVFVSADVHTTFINKLTYQTEALGELIPVRSFEISTGSVAFFPPTGAALVAGAADAGLFPADDYAAYQAASIPEQDAVLLNLYNRFVNRLQGYEEMSLDGSGLNAELTEGTFVAGHTFGWTEFDIDAETQRLTATTYGVRAYSRDALDADPATILALRPEVINQVVADPITA
ncbi:MAG: alkaline phosphatase D family protein [bacterium]|nr:alkaline phosphatase D family protein [bacterium]